LSILTKFTLKSDILNLLRFTCRVF
jgi:hypothetical protein